VSSRLALAIIPAIPICDSYLTGYNDCREPFLQRIASALAHSELLSRSQGGNVVVKVELGAQQSHLVGLVRLGRAAEPPSASNCRRVYLTFPFARLCCQRGALSILSASYQTSGVGQPSWSAAVPLSWLGIRSPALALGLPTGRAVPHELILWLGRTGCSRSPRFRDDSHRRG
jgi:hypothetical protein